MSAANLAKIFPTFGTLCLSMKKPLILASLLIGVFSVTVGARSIVDKLNNRQPLEEKEIPEAIKLLADRNVALSAEWALADKGSAAVPYLIVAIEQDANPLVRGLSIETLGRIKDPSAMPTLIKAIRQSDDQQLRYTAVSALAEFNESGLDALAALTKDPDKEIRLVAMDSLIRLGRRRNVNSQGATPSRIVSILVTALSDAESSVRLAAVDGLSFYKKSNPNAEKALKKASSDKSVRVRLAARQAIDPNLQPVVGEPFFGKRSTNDTGSVDFSQAKTSFDLRQIVQSELNKYTGDGKIELVQAKYGPGASTYGFSITLPEFEPVKLQTLTYKLTGIPVWDQKGLARSARFHLQTLIPGTTDWSDIPDDLVIISSRTHFIRAKLIDADTQKILAEKSEYVANLLSTRVDPVIQPLAPIRVVFDVDLPEAVGRSIPVFVVNYDPKRQPIKRKMRLFISVNPPPG